MLSIIEFGQLTFDSKELERDAHGVKVLLRPDDRIVKLFRVKHIFSLALIYPYSLRFRRNAQRLTERGINTVTVEQIFYCHAIRRHGVVYPLLQGDTLEELLKSQPDRSDLMQRLARYMAQLHDKGIYFRSLHLGNVLLLKNGELGLIDVADAHFSSGPLSRDKRARNFQHLFRRRQHRALFERFGTERFVNLYLDAAGLPAVQAERIRSRILARP